MAANGTYFPRRQRILAWTFASTIVGAILGTATVLVWLIVAACRREGRR